MYVPKAKITAIEGCGNLYSYSEKGRQLYNKKQFCVEKKMLSYRTLVGFFTGMSAHVYN